MFTARVRGKLLPASCLGFVGLFLFTSPHPGLRVLGSIILPLRGFTSTSEPVRLRKSGDQLWPLSSLGFIGIAKADYQKMRSTTLHWL